MAEVPPKIPNSFCPPSKARQVSKPHLTLRFISSFGTSESTGQLIYCWKQRSVQTFKSVWNILSLSSHCVLEERNAKLGNSEILALPLMQQGLPFVTMVSPGFTGVLRQILRGILTGLEIQPWFLNAHSKSVRVVFLSA